MEGAGFKDIRTNRFIWRNLFKSPTDACDFFSAVTSSWWYALSLNPKEIMNILRPSSILRKKT
jgi:hypothetical protein